MSGGRARIDDIVRRRRINNWFQEESWHRGDPELQPENGRIFLPQTSGMEEPERYFSSDDFCTAVLLLSRELLCGSAYISFCRWNYGARCSYGQLEYRTNLGFEGLPETAWEQEAMRFIVAGSRGDLIAILPSDDRWVIEVATWLANPNKVPKSVEIEVPTPPLPLWKPDSDDEGESPPRPSSPTSRKAMVFPLIIHVKEVLDRGPLMSELPSKYLPNEGVDLSRIHVFDTWRGKVDGSGPDDNGKA
ncbi:hypothetical protein VPH35_068919 [Triticum aestivum]